MSKVYPNSTAALAGLLHDNMTIAAGGFGLCGIPENLIVALRDSGVKGLTMCNATTGYAGFAGTFWTGASTFEVDSGSMCGVYGTFVR